MSEIHSESPTMTPQISPNDIPQSTSDSESEEEPAVTNIIQESSSSDEEDGEMADNDNSGYVPLSMSDGNDNNYGLIQEPEVESHDLESSENQQEETTSSEEIHVTASVSSRSHTSRVEAPMDSDQVKLIQQVMSNISIPLSAIPEWAKLVPEDRWKNSLLTSLENRTDQETTTNNSSKPDSKD